MQCGVIVIVVWNHLVVGRRYLLLLHAAFDGATMA